MRVLHIISGDLWAGAEVQAYTLLATLRRQAGIEVATVLMNEGELASRLRMEGISVTVLPEAQLNPWTLLNRLRGLMLDWQPSVVHTHRLKENVLGAIANGLSCRAPSIRTVHGANEHIDGLRNIHRRLFHWVDWVCGSCLQQKIIAVSAPLAEELAKEYSPTKVRLIQNGISLTSVRARMHTTTLRTSDKKSVHIGIAGRLTPVKRIDLFLEAAAMLYKTQPGRNWRFHIFGDGPLRNALVEQAKALQIDNIVTFHGHTNEIVAYIASLDGLMISSDHEGLPMVALESVVAGTPVVAHAVGGLTEVLDGNAGGVLVHNHSASGYCEGVLAMLDLNKQMIMQRGLERISSRFSAETNASNVYKLYNELLTKRLS